MQYYLLSFCTYLMSIFFQGYDLPVLCTFHCPTQSSFIFTISTFFCYFYFLPLEMCDETHPARFRRLPSSTATTAQNNVKSHFTAAPTSAATIARRYYSWAEMLFTFLTVSLHILGEKASTPHVEDLLRPLGNQDLDIALFDTRVKNAEGCCLFATELAENLQNTQ